MAHMWHDNFRVVELCWECAVPFNIAGTFDRLFPVVHVSELKRVRIFPDRLINRLRVKETGRADFNGAILPENIWKTELDTNEFEVEKIVDVRSGRVPRFGRVHRQVWSIRNDTVILIGV